MASLKRIIASMRATHKLRRDYRRTMRVIRAARKAEK